MQTFDAAYYSYSFYAGYCQTMNLHHLKIDIDRLRDIGWTKWDPIGLLRSAEVWRGKPFEDEYDTYLLRAAGMLRNGQAQEEVVDYLLGIETEYMGLGTPSDVSKSRTRLMDLAKAIGDDPLLWGGC